MIFSYASAPAQKQPFYYSTKGHFGFIIPHASSIRGLAKSADPWGVQLEVSRLNLTEKAWKKCNCYNRNGISVSYFNFGNPDELGGAFVSSYFAEGYVKPMGSFKMAIRFSAGASHVNKIYNALSNPENEFFSARLNFYLGLSTVFYWLVNENWALNLAGHYNHISNAGGKQPNKGMNFPTISFGIDRILNSKSIDPDPFTREPVERSFSWMLGLFGSLRSADESSEKSSYPLMGLTTDLLFPLTRINGLNLGLEVSFDDSYRERLERIDVDQSAWISSVLFGHQFVFGRVYLLQQFGFYVTKPGKVQEKDHFQRYSGFYRFNSWAFGTSLIAYANVADHMDLRIVYFIR